MKTKDLETKYDYPVYVIKDKKIRITLMRSYLEMYFYERMEKVVHEDDRQKLKSGFLLLVAACRKKGKKAYEKLLGRAYEVYKNNIENAPPVYLSLEEAVKALSEKLNK
jgi:hypothetical protein